MSFGQIVFIGFLIALNGFFVSVEFAVVAVRRSRLDLLASPENAALRLVRSWLEDKTARDRLIAASQLGITLASLALGAIGKDAFEMLLAPAMERLDLPANLSFFSNLLPALPLVFSLAVVASLHVVLGEQVPKVAVLRSPERFVLLAAPLMQVFIQLFWGFTNLLDLISHAILRFFGLPANGHTHSAVISAEELKYIVSGPEIEGAMEQSEREMISAVIDFGALVVRQVMVPRTEIIAVEAATPLTDAIQVAARHGITKLPVYEENMDHIAGVLHIKDLLPLIQEGQLDNRAASSLAREALFVPETVSVNDLLLHMRGRRQHMAITLDEYGGTAGLVTLEDLLEEIVGEVMDEFDADTLPIQMLPDGSALIDGMAMIEDINKKFDLNLFDPNYDTIAGYILGKLGRIPQSGDTVEDIEQKICLKVDAMERLRISKIHFSRLVSDAPQ